MTIIGQVHCIVKGVDGEPNSEDGKCVSVFFLSPDNGSPTFLPRAVAGPLEIFRLRVDVVLRNDILPPVSILAGNDSQRMTEAATGLLFNFGSSTMKCEIVPG